MSLKTRLDTLTRRLPGGGANYSYPETVDVRDLGTAQRAAAIAGAEERAEGKRFAGVSVVIIDEHIYQN